MAKSTNRWLLGIPICIISCFSLFWISDVQFCCAVLHLARKPLRRWQACCREAGGCSLHVTRILSRSWNAGNGVQGRKRLVSHGVAWRRSCNSPSVICLYIYISFSLYIWIYLFIYVWIHRISLCPSLSLALSLSLSLSIYKMYVLFVCWLCCYWYDAYT